MTGKRFEIETDSWGATDVDFYLKDNLNELVDSYGDKIYWGNGSCNGLKQIVDLLNSLVDENKQLKKRISDYADITAITTHILNEEKEIAEEGIVLSVNRFHELVEENEQLKRRNKKFEKHLRRFYSDEEWELKKALGDFE